MLPPPMSSTTPSVSVLVLTAATYPNRASSSAESVSIRSPVVRSASARNCSPLAASRMALVATTWTSSGARWLARQKRANTLSVSWPRVIASSLRRPEAASPAPMRTVS